MVMLEAASAEEQQGYIKKVHASAGKPELRLQQLDQAAGSGDGALAQALLWSPLSPGSSTLNVLQRDQQASCKTIASKR